ncbi:Lysine-specific demethylase, partial [Thalictrum thalictroides]
FNCSEAANIATPEWLMVAKEAAVRRAAINYPPVVSHLQLLYALALSLCSRIPLSISTEPRSSRLKEKKKSEGETKVKELFVESVIQNNEFLHDLLEQGSSCILLPTNSLDSICPNVNLGSQVVTNPRFSVGACSPEEDMGRLENADLDEIMLDRNTQIRQQNGFRSMKQYSSCVRKGNRPPPLSVKNPQNDNAVLRTYPSERQCTNTEKESASQTDRLLDHKMFSCLTCGILSCACAAIIQPREETSKYIVSADCSLFNDWIVASGAPDNEYSNADRFANTSELNSCSGQMGKSDHDDANNVDVQCSSYQAELLNERVEGDPDIDAQKGISSLNLLAAAYGNLSDSDDENAESEMPVSGDENDTFYNQKDRSRSADEMVTSTRTFACADSVDPGYHDERMKSMFHLPSSIGDGSEFSSRISWCPSSCNKIHVIATANGRYEQHLENSLQSKLINTMPKLSKCSSPEGSACDHADLSTKSTMLDSMPNCYPDPSSATNNHGILDISTKNIQIPFKQRSGEDSPKGHIFCLEHAVEVEKQLRTVGGVHVLLVCHSDYPRVETEAKALAEELGINYTWKHISYREATEDEVARIRSSLSDKQAVPRNKDWTVKLGINLPYNASISQSPFYRKKMPYSSVVSKAFGCSSPTKSLVKPKIFGKRPGVNNKIVVAGRWCGKVWMSDQVHPYLAQRACQKEETSASFRSQATSEVKVKIEIKPELSDESEQTLSPQWKSLRSLTTTVTRKTDKKRKGTLKKEATKKQKCSQPDSLIEAVEDSPTHDSPPRCRRILRTGQAKRKTSPICSNRVKQKEEAAGGRGKRLKKKSYKLLEDEELKPIKQAKKKIMKKASNISKDKIIKDEEQEYHCDIENCTMVLSSKQELKLHKRNICLVEGCDKKFLSHRYLEQHERVHMDDRPLKCPWKGCKMSFKWAWARTEHIRVHTGVRPYECQEPGCGQTFRFVTDFSRHRRKTGHSVKKVIDD